MARLVSFFLLNGLLFAQTSPPVFDPLSDAFLIEEGLHSTVPLQVAISASRCVNIIDQRRGAWLRAALKESLLLQPEVDAVRARRAIFDALIRTRTPVPLADLLPHFDRFATAVIVIVAKNNPKEGEDHLPLLLKAEEAKNAVYWHATLALVERKQLVRYLFQRARFDYAISVWDQDFLPVRINGALPSSVSGGVIGTIPNGPVVWPDTTTYHIEMSGNSDHVLTYGPGQATYLRESLPADPAFPDSEPAEPRAWEDHDRDVVRVLLSIAYCGVCPFDGGDYPNVRGGRASIVWHSLEQARPLLEEAVEHYVKECVRMVNALNEMTVSESEIRSKVRIWVRDVRRVQTIAIPSVGVGVEFNRCAPGQKGSSKGPCIN